MKPQKSEPPLLRGQIQVCHGQVINISPKMFYEKHIERVNEYIASQGKESFAR